MVEYYSHRLSMDLLLQREFIVPHFLFTSFTFALKHAHFSHAFIMFTVKTFVTCDHARVIYYFEYNGSY